MGQKWRLCWGILSRDQAGGFDTSGEAELRAIGGLGFAMSESLLVRHFFWNQNFRTVSTFESILIALQASQWLQGLELPRRGRMFNSDFCSSVRSGICCFWRCFNVDGIWNFESVRWSVQHQGNTSQTPRGTWDCRFFGCGVWLCAAREYT